MSRKVATKSGAGFTLIELLVVVAIIAMLVALILPALARARDSAQAIKCLSQMKQLGQGVRIYNDANKQWLPVGGWSGSGQRSYAWARVVAAELSITYLTEQNIPSQGVYTAQWVSQAVNRDNNKNNGIFQCPSDVSVNFWKTRHATSYGWNSGYATAGVHTCLGVGDRYNPGTPSYDERMRRVRETEVRTPSATIMLGEQMPRVNYTEENYTQLQGNLPISTYHNGGSNALYCDGSARRIKQENFTAAALKRNP